MSWKIQSPKACEQAAKVSPRIEYKLSLCCIVLPLTLMFRSMRGRGCFRNLHMYLIFILPCIFPLPPSLPPSLARALSRSLSLSGTTSTVPHGEEARNRQAEAPYIVVYEFTLLFSIRLYKLYTEPEMLNNDIAKICPGDSKGASQKEHQRLHPGNGLCDNLLWQLTMTT